MTGGTEEMVIPVTAYGADIEYDLLLAYDWLRKSNMLLYAGTNALLIPGDPVRWVWGTNPQRPRYRQIVGMDEGPRKLMSQLRHILTIQGVVGKTNEVKKLLVQSEGSGSASEKAFSFSQEHL